MKITVETAVAAPIEKVWRAYTTPADIVQWNAASEDWHTTKATVDLREGGAFSSRMEAKDGSFGFDFAGTYTKIVEHQLIEYAFGDREAKVEFLDSPGGVRVRVHGQRWQGAGLTLTTTNGGVTFDVPDGYSAELEARTTNGGIRVDFPITVQGSLSRRYVNATLGSGGAPIKLTTTNGGISVSRR